jgi:cap1 methyltransferase
MSATGSAALLWDLKVSTPLDLSLVRFLPSECVTILDEANMLSCPYCPDALIKDLWVQKRRLDPVFDQGHSKLYSRARETIFPQDRRGSLSFANRAGDKLDEIDRLTDCLPTERFHPHVFVDLCGAPGAWSLHLIARFANCSCLGLSLSTPDVPASRRWYSHLLDKKNFEPIYGPTEYAGSIYEPRNLDALLFAAAKRASLSDIQIASGNLAAVLTAGAPPPAPEAVASIVPCCDLVVGDGGMVVTGPNGEHCEHLQELISARIVLGEFLFALRGLKPGGSFVCKLFDVFSRLSESLLFLFCHVFASVRLIKPSHSRLVNSERYLVCTNLCASASMRQRVVDVLMDAHAHGFADKVCPSYLVDPKALQDSAFRQSIETAVCDLCIQSTSALKKVLDETDRLIALQPPASRTGQKRGLQRLVHHHQSFGRPVLSYKPLYNVE